MNASTFFFISAHNSLMDYSYSLPGVEWTLHAIGGDEILVGGPKVRCSAEQPVNSDKNGRLVFTYNW